MPGVSLAILYISHFLTQRLPVFAHRGEGNGFLQVFDCQGFRFIELYFVWLFCQVARKTIVFVILVFLLVLDQGCYDFREIVIERSEYCVDTCCMQAMGEFLHIHLRLLDVGHLTETMR